MNASATLRGSDQVLAEYRSARRICKLGLPILRAVNAG